MTKSVIDNVLVGRHAKKTEIWNQDLSSNVGFLDRVALPGQLDSTLSCGKHTLTRAVSLLTR